MNKKNIIVAVLIILVGVSLIGFWWWQNYMPGKLDVFAKCLGEKNVKFYGAFWCSHCQAQKKLFGSSKRHLPYIECSKPDGNGQLPVCTQAGVTSYPTWVFSDGSKEVGELTLQTLSEKSGCQLPQ